MWVSIFLSFHRAAPCAIDFAPSELLYSFQCDVSHRIHRSGERSVQFAFQLVGLTTDL
jgi:hypothetical protein